MTRSTTQPRQKWGIIYCPKEGSRKTQRRWKKIRHLLNEQGVGYDFVQSEGRGSVERLATMFTENGYRTIVVVGGDAALNDALNGILSASKPGMPHPALGVIPNGFGNDFAHFWELEEKNYRQTVLSLLQGHKRRVDVGRAQWKEGEGSTTRYFLNCVNIGIAASITSIRRKTRSFWGSNTLSYLTSALLLLFRRLSWRLHFSVNHEDVECKAMTACIGSAHGYGQTPSAVPYNGLLDISVVTTPPLGRIWHGVCLLLAGRFLAHPNVKIWRTKGICFHDTMGAPISFDGRVLHHPVETLDIDILEEEIDFLIP